MSAPTTAPFAVRECHCGCVVVLLERQRPGGTLPPLRHLIRCGKGKLCDHRVKTPPGHAPAQPERR